MVAFLKAQPNATILSVSQNDNQNYCKDPAELAAISKYGSPIAPLLLAVNSIARSIKDDFPHVAIDTLAYQYTRPPPTGIQPEPNVIIRLCSIECNFARPLSDPSNAPFQKDLVGWAALSKRLFIWNYITNFRNFLPPFPDWYQQERPSRCKLTLYLGSVWVPTLRICQRTASLECSKKEHTRGQVFVNLVAKTN